MKKVISSFMSLVILLSITAGLNLTVNAETIEGFCGDNVTYSLDSSKGTLTISGTGAIKSYSFQYSNISELVINDGVTIIEDSAFAKCENLKDVVLPSTLTRIETRAFFECVSLTSIDIPNGVEYIGDVAFAFCENLSFINVPDSVLDLGSNAFGYTQYVETEENWNNDILYIGRHLVRAKETVEECVVNPGTFSISTQAFFSTNLSSIDLPDSLLYIHEEAFCQSLLSEIHIPKNVIEIGSRALESYELTKITVAPTNEFYVAENDVLYNKDKTTLIKCAAKLQSFTIPNTVKIVENSAFRYQTLLTDLTIPDSVEYIGDYAFVFLGADSESPIPILELPNSVKYIGENAFYSSNIISFSLPNDLCYLGHNAFLDTKYINSIVKDEYGVRYIDNYLYDADNCSLNITVKDGTTLISSNAFSHTGITSIVLPETLKYINEAAFVGCQLKELVLPNSVCRIGCFILNNPNTVLYVYNKDCEIEYDIDAIFNQLIVNKIYGYKDSKAELFCKTYNYEFCYIECMYGHDYSTGKNCFVCGAVNPDYVDPTTQVQTTAQETTVNFQEPTTTTSASIAKKPKATSIKKLTKGKKSFKAKWKKITGVSGYQIQYSTDKKFKKNTKTVTIKKNTTSATIKKLKANKKYYVRVRSYKNAKVNGKTVKVYSSWSKVKSVKTK